MPAELVSDLGIARRCCDAWPRGIQPALVRSADGSGSGHRGNTRWHSLPVLQSATVYVPAVELGLFLDRWFARLPSSSRITVVSGMENIGLPREFFASDASQRSGRDDPRNPCRFVMRNCNSPLPSLRRFLSDERLAHLFVQNYDLTGCSIFGAGLTGNPYRPACAPQKICDSLGCNATAAWSGKVTPIPIGVSLWPYFPSMPPLLPTTQLSDPQLQWPLHAARAEMLPLSQRLLAISVSFRCEAWYTPLHDHVTTAANNLTQCRSSATCEDAAVAWDRLDASFNMKQHARRCRESQLEPNRCLMTMCSSTPILLRTSCGQGEKRKAGATSCERFVRITKPDRLRACAALEALGRSPCLVKRLPTPSDKVQVESSMDVLQQLRSTAFTAAPQGHGLDTHRVWEALATGTVPVVVTSSLDRLYSQLPVIILQSWEQLGTASEATLREWREVIRQRFPDFAERGEVPPMLTLQFWVDLIRRTHNEVIARAPTSTASATLETNVRNKKLLLNALGESYSWKHLEGVASFGTWVNSEHGWQSSCKPPCTVFALHDLNEVGALPQHFELLSAPALTQADDQQEADALGASSDIALPVRLSHLSWIDANRNPVLRVRTAVMDGFFVRVIFVFAQGLWASKLGIPFFVEPHVHAACGDPHRTCSSGLVAPSEADCLASGGLPCDAYFDPTREGNAWEQYFEPIGGADEHAAAVAQRVGEASIIELDGTTAWMLYSVVDIYPSQAGAALAARMRFARLASKWARVRPDLLRARDAEWRRQVVQCSCKPCNSSQPLAVLGVHMRGTDKVISTVFEPEAYFPLINSFVEAQRRRGKRVVIFLATDDAGFRSRVQRQYDRTCGLLAWQHHNRAQLSRSTDIAKLNLSQIQAEWKQASSSAEAHRKGEAVLLDSLLLSKTDFLLKSNSAVSEFAIYFNPKLARASFDFNIVDQELPDWAVEVPLDRRDLILGVPFGCVAHDYVLQHTRLLPETARELHANCDVHRANSDTAEALRTLQQMFEQVRRASIGCDERKLTRVATAPFVIGWMSHLHSWLKPTLRALREGRALVPPPAREWVDANQCPSQSLECFFDPFTTTGGACDSRTAATRRRHSTSVISISADPKAEFESRESYALHGEEVIPSPFRHLGWFWWVSNVFRRMLKPNPLMAAELQSALTQTGMQRALARPTPIIGMHVRRGDACSGPGAHIAHGRQCLPLSAYMEVANRIRQAHGARDIYLATDSYQVVEEARRSYGYFNIMVHESALQTSTRAYKQRSPKKFMWEDIVRQNARKGHAGDNMWTARTTTQDVMLLAKADILVGQFSSNVFRAAFELKAAECGCVPVYESLDSTWCFDFALRTNVNPVLGNASIIC